MGGGLPEDSSAGAVVVFLPLEHEMALPDLGMDIWSDFS